VTGYFTPGTFQQYKVAPARFVMPIPDGLDPAAAATLMCAGVTVYTSLKHAQIKVGDWVAISGAGGGLGHLGIQYAKAMGGRVVAIDHGTKEAFCRGLGADEFVDFTQFSKESALTSQIKRLTDGGAKIALICNAKSYPRAMSWLGFRGTIACIGLPEQPGALVPDIGVMIMRELRIIGRCSISSYGNDFPAFHDPSLRRVA
jgi:alcohol dehydrogenase, propanol-preferring